MAYSPDNLRNLILSNGTFVTAQRWELTELQVLWPSSQNLFSSHSTLECRLHRQVTDGQRRFIESHVKKVCPVLTECCWKLISIIVIWNALKELCGVMWSPNTDLHHFRALNLYTGKVKWHSITHFVILNQNWDILSKHLYHMGNKIKFYFIDNVFQSMYN